MFSNDKADPKKPGRIKRVYRPQDAMTPLDKLASLPDAHTCLREGITLEHLRELATALTDMQAAEELNEAGAALFKYNGDIERQACWAPALRRTARRHPGPTSMGHERR